MAAGGDGLKALDKYFAWRVRLKRIPTSELAEAAEFPDDSPSAFEVLEAADDRARLVHCLEQLDERYRARSADGVHDLLLHLGDLSTDEVAARSTVAAAETLDALARDRRAIAIPSCSQRNWRASTASRASR